MNDKKTHCVYLLLCADESLYCGYSNDPKARVARHNSGKGAKYTRARLPVRLVYLERFSTKGEALSREAAVKRLSRARKLELVANGPRPERP